MNIDKVKRELTIAKVRLYHLQNGSLKGMTKEATGMGKSAAYNYFAAHPNIPPLGAQSITEEDLIKQIDTLEAMLGNTSKMSNLELVTEFKDKPEELARLTEMTTSEARRFINSYDYLSDEILISEAEALIEEALEGTEAILDRYLEGDREIAKEAIAILRIIDKVMLDKCKEPRDFIAYHRARNLSYKAQKGI